MRSVVVTVTILLCAGGAYGDIYRYVNEEGVECFSDAPTTGTASVYVREAVSPPPRGKRVGKRHVAQPPAENAGSSSLPVVTGTFPVPGRITSLVGLRHDPIDGILRHHQGIDIATPTGTPVRCIAPGTVSFSGMRPGYGNTVVVDHDDGTVTIYAHNSTNVAVAGTRIEAAAVIAYSGSTGHSTGPHLHFEAWKNGSNVTAAVIGAPSAPDHDDGIRRILGSDGTLIFTNLR